MGKFTYMLRKTLPLWKPEETIAEVRDYCLEYDIDEVMWKVDVEEFNHGLTPISMIHEYVPWLNRAREVLSEVGIKYSINPWVTHNHADRNRDMAKIHPQMSFMQDWTGVKSKACACSLSQAWRDWLCEAYRLYASTGPSVLWVEDDIRTFNHQPVTYGCFCKDHIERFSERVGKRVSREEVVKGILSPGELHPWRAEWLDMMGDIMIEVATLLEKSVHDVDANVQLGLMCSFPDDHAIEGRRWHEFVNALSGTHDPVVRPCMCAYSEVKGPDLIKLVDVTRQTVYCVPSNSRICPELENWTFTTFNKSVRFSRLQIGISALLGYKDITMNLYDHLGTPMTTELQYGEMLKETKPLLEELIQGIPDGGCEIGVGLFHNDQQANHVYLEPGALFGDMRPNAMGWSHSLQSSGIPITFHSSPVTALTGQIARVLSDDNIMDLLSSGVLLDLSAGRVLQELGYGKYLPAKISVHEYQGIEPVVAEEYFNRDFGGSPETYMTMQMVAHHRPVGILDLSEGSIEVSRFVNQDRESVHSALLLGENELGGRVAQYAVDLSCGASGSFLNWHRATQLWNLVKWLSKDNTSIRALGGAYLYTVCRSYGDLLYVGLANLSTDDCTKIGFEIALSDGRRPASVRLIGVGETGKVTVEYIDSSMYRIEVDYTLRSLDFTGLLVKLER